MKKLLFAFATLALISSAQAQEGADIKWNAEMRFRFTNMENEGFVKSANDNQTQQRTKIGATMTKGEDLTATVTLLSASTWGNEGATNTSGDFTAEGSESNVYVYEAFAFWKAMDNFALKVGRGALDLADGSVVAKNDWEQTPWAFEGVYGVYFTEWANIGVFGVKGMNDETTAVAPATTSADINFYGISVDFKSLPEWIKMANFHILQSKATGVDPDGAGALKDIKDDKTRFGVTLKGDASHVDYRATYAMYTGEQNVAGTKLDNEANMLDAEVGYTLPDVMNMRISAIYHMDSGDSSATKNERYDAFFYEKHANAGLMDIVNWGNLTYMKVGVALEPMEMTKVGVDYYMFTKSEKGDATVGTDNAGTLTTLTTDDDIGSEIDIWATKTLSNGAELNARIGMFQAGDAIAANPEDVTQFSLGATFKF